MKNKQIICGDCLEVMKRFPSGSVDLVVTSPPYWGLRSYLPNTVKLRKDLSKEEISFVMKELTKLGIKPMDI